MIHSTKNQDKGFTLVELLIVIVILGILATVTVFAVGGITSNAETNACQVELKGIETAAAAFRAENSNADPGSDADLTDYVEQDALDKFSITYSPFVIADGSGAGSCTI